MILALLLCLQQSVEMNEYGSSYLLRLPDGYSEAKSWPVILALHENGGKEEARAALDRWAPLAERGGYIVAVPVARKRAWGGATDPRFVEACLDNLKGRAWVDPGRVLVTGHAAGADFALRFAEERSGVLAGCAVFMPTGATRAVNGPPYFFTFGSKDGNREKAQKIAEEMEGRGLDVRSNLILGAGSEPPPDVARENVLAWFGEKANSSSDLRAVAAFMKEGRYLDASLALMGLMGDDDLKPQVKWELNRIEAFGMFELGKVEVAMVNGNYADAVLRCRRAATQCAWVPVGERIRARLSKLESDPRVKKALRRRE